MNIVVKKVLCLFVILIIALAGCNKSKNDDFEFIEASINPNKIVPINVYVYSFYGSDPNKYIEERTTFTKILKQKFGVELNASGVGFPNITRETVENFDGLIKINRSSLKNWSETGLISPLTNLLKNNDTWNSLPYYYRDNGMINGELWGIPAKTLANMNFYARFVKSAWLDKLMLNKPETLNQYYDCMKAFVYDDPDGNGVNDTIGFTSVGLYGLNDIFNSFGCRMSPTGTYKLAWDPINNKFTDGLRSEYIIDCLSFLNTCYSEGLLHKSFKSITQFSIMSEYKHGNIGSISHLITFYDDLENQTEKHDIIPALEGKIREKIIPVFYECSDFYMLTSSTENKSDIINKFVDIFLGNETGYFMGVYGIPDIENEINDFSIKGETITLNFEMENNRLTKREYPNILSGHPVYSKYEAVYINATDNNIYDVLSNFDRRIAQEVISQQEKLFYIANDKYRYTFSHDYFIGSMIREKDISELGTQIIFNSITGKVDIIDALEEYENMVLKMGLDKIIERVNEDINSGKY